MTEAEFRALYERLRAQVPWGPDDRRGALNYITQAEVLAALRRGQAGPSPCHWPRRWRTGRAPDNPDPARHQMKEPLGATPAGGCRSAMDRIAMNIHGNADSHIDALCHVIFDGKLYNGGARGHRHRRPGRPSCPSASPPTASSAGECCWTCRGPAACPGWSRATT